ncbi:hypothetical protein PT974_07535 [Cladobotryum mycophilum]|uniref:NACHT-NTPase and P-loop NTPases N-terminal domain-containing protein n=1 Tax=Cladobotryum mycophilum TaxID=491253 RepID=A0ABR0SQT4_9HYPO
MAIAKTLGLIRNLVNTAQFIMETYEDIKDVDGLPEAFHEVNKKLLLVIETLRAANAHARENRSKDEAEAKVVTELLERRQSLHHFCVVGKSGKEDFVETLITGVVEEMQTLTEQRVFKAATQAQIEALARDRDELAKVPPSLPESEYEEPRGSVSLVGDHNHQNNNFGGNQKNVNGNTYESGGGNMTFSRDER